MGRGKSAPPAQQEQPRQAEEVGAVASNLNLCAICSDHVDSKEEFLRVFCNKCNECTVHLECGIEYLIARANEKTNSIAQHKYKVKARKQPVHIFEQRVPCPNGVSQVESDGHRMPGSQPARSKHTVIGTCGGFTTGAELVKPPKDPPVQMQQTLQARAPKEKKDKGKAAAPKRTTPAASPAASAPTPRRPAPGLPTPGAGASARLLGARATAGARKLGGAAVPGALPSGPSRPLELTMCKHLLEDGDCFVYRCPTAHSEEELRQREVEWAARQEGKKREAARRQAAAQAAAAARFVEEQELLAQIASVESLYTAAPSDHAPTEEWGNHAATPNSPSIQATSPALHLTDRSLTLMRAFKRSCCLNTLLSMGFSADQAAAATDAAACDAERAAQLALDGVHAADTLPANVSREADELASAAVAAGADAEAVEAALVLTGGNWQAAIDTLLSSQECSAPAGSTATAEDLASWALSEPDTPSQRGPSAAPWAADAASSLSSPSPFPASPCGAASWLAAAPPGVLSLADFSAGPAPGAEPAGASGLASGVQEGAAVNGSVTAQRLLGLDQPSWEPAPVGTLPADNGQQAGLAAGTPADGFQDGFAAGMAAAAAMFGQQQPPAHTAPMSEASAGMPGYWPAHATTHQAAPEGQEQELNDLLQMLGVG